MMAGEIFQVRLRGGKNLGWEFVSCIRSVDNLLFTHKSVDGFDSIANPGVVYVVMHILPVLISYQYAGVLQNAKMLGSNGLLNLEGIVNLINLYVLILI